MGFVPLVCDYPHVFPTSTSLALLYSLVRPSSLVVQENTQPSTGLGLDRMPADRLRKSHKKQRPTEANTSHPVHGPIAPELAYSWTYNHDGEEDEDESPPLVENPADDLPPLVPYHDSSYFELADYPPGQDLPRQEQHPVFILPTAEEPQSMYPPGIADPIFPEATNPPPSPVKPSHHKKKPADHIPRPPNAFILFRASFIKAQHVPGSIEPNNNTLSRIIGLCWKSLPQEERDIWKEKARKAMEEHKRLYPSYRYNPRDQQNRLQSTGRAKRKVKEIAGPPPDPARCEEIARMLVEGKKGDELENAVKELDNRTATHAPPSFSIVQATFEQPMTERAFRRRSLSVPPPPHKEEDELPELRMPTPVKPRSRRTSRKRSQSTSVVKKEGDLDITPTKQRETVHEMSSESDASTPFKYYAETGNSRSPSRVRQHTSAPQTPTLPTQGRATRGRRTSNLQGHRQRPSSEYISTQHTASNIPSFMTAAMAEPLISPHVLEPSPVVFGVDNGPSLFEALPRRPRPHYATTFSSLEGWDGVALSSRGRNQVELAAPMYSAAAETITSASNSPITPPYQFRFDNSQQPSPMPLTGHVSEYLDSQWAYDAPIFDLGSSMYHSPNTVGAVGGYREEIQQPDSVPCSPNGIRTLTGHIHGLVISGEPSNHVDHRQRSLSLDSGAHHAHHAQPQLIHFNSQTNFKA